MDSLNRGVDRLLEVTFAWLPQLIGAVILILLGFILARLISNLVSKGLNRVGLDRRMHSAVGGTFIQRAVPSPTNIVSIIVYWLVFLGIVSLAASVLGIPALNQLVSGVYSFIPRVVASMLIFLVASAVSAAVVALIRNTMGDTPTGKIIEGLAPVIVVGIGTFMILEQLGIAPAIVMITYTALIGSVALGSALAFGLGGRDVAARMLEQTYEGAKRQKGQVKSDFRTAKERGRMQADDLRSSLQ